jgi:hypothetical protein
MAAANNDQGAYRLFLNRKEYHDSAWDYYIKRPIPLDMWYNKPFYGRLDSYGNAISVKNQYMRQVPNRSKNVFALNFVVDAYENMIEYYNIGINVGKVKIQNSNLVTLEAKEGWHSQDKQYDLYLSNIVYKAFNASFMAKGFDDKVSNFEDFMGLFKKFLSKAIPGFPLTRVGYISSTKNDPITSGLMLEILIDADCGDDKKKYDSFINDPNINFYLYTAQRYGFKIDKNAPWRLVADLGSPIMQKFMENYPIPPDPPLLSKQDFFSGDIVEVPLLLFDPTILDKSESRSDQVLMRVREYDPVKKLAFLSPVPGFEDHPATTGNLYKKYQQTGVGGKHLLALELFEPGSDRSSYSGIINDYKKQIEIYSAIPPLSIDNLFERYYNKAYLDDVDSLMNTAIRFYNAYVNSNPTVTIKEYCNKRQRSTAKVIRRFPVNIEQVLMKYPTDYWLKFYAELRSAEVEWKPSKQKYDEFLNRIKDLYKFKGTIPTLEYINLKLNGIFKPKIGLTNSPKNDINLNK